MDQDHTLAIEQAFEMVQPEWANTPSTWLGLSTTTRTSVMPGVLASFHTLRQRQGSMTTTAESSPVLDPLVRRFFFFFFSRIFFAS